MIAPPRLLVLTDQAYARRSGHELADVVGAALDAGAPAVLFREKDLARPARARLAASIAERVQAAGALLLVASDAVLAAAVGAAGVHLAASDPALADYPGLVGRSCHTGADLDRAGHEAMSYATLSPVFASVSKPGHGPMSSNDVLIQLAPRPGRPPVLALGGVTAAGVGSCRAAGAWGVAVLGAVMGADDPALATRSLLAALEATT